MLEIFKVLFKSKKKYLFVEFLAAMEGDDFDVLEKSWLDHYQRFVDRIPEMLQTVHYGDCTRSCQTCDICLLEGFLKDYREYYFNEDKWRKDNL